MNVDKMKGVIMMEMDFMDDEEKKKMMEEIGEKKEIVI